MNDYIKNNKLYIVWTVDNIIDRAKMKEIIITKKQAIKVLKIMLGLHSYKFGLTWKDVDYAILKII